MPMQDRQRWFFPETSRANCRKADSSATAGISSAFGKRIALGTARSMSDFKSAAPTALSMSRTSTASGPICLDAKTSTDFMAAARDSDMLKFPAKDLGELQK